MMSRVVEASFVASVKSTGALPPPTLAEVAFGGRSNVGKSSLLNALLGRHKLVRVGSTPGTTRSLNVFFARMADGLCLHLLDLPGYGYARASKKEKADWRGVVEGYLKGRVTLRAVVVLVDVRRGLEPDDLALIDFVQNAGRTAQRPPVEVVLVATKTDKLPPSARKRAVETIARQAGRRPVPFSAVTGEGTDVLWHALRATICRTS